MRAVEQGRDRQSLKFHTTQTSVPSNPKQTEINDGDRFHTEQQPEENCKKSPANFATEILAPAVQKADQEPDTQKAFQMMKGPYKEAYKLGLAMGFLPKGIWRRQASAMSISRLLRKRFAAVDPGFCDHRAWSTALGSCRSAWFWLGRAETQMDRRGDKRSEPPNI